MKLYGKGLECFEEDEIKGQLEKYLLRNFGQELINALVEFFLVEAGIQGGNVSADFSRLTRSWSPYCVAGNNEELFINRSEIWRTRYSLEKYCTSPKVPLPLIFWMVSKKYFKYVGQKKISSPYWLRLVKVLKPNWSQQRKRRIQRYSSMFLSF